MSSISSLGTCHPDAAHPPHLLLPPNPHFHQQTNTNHSPPPHHQLQPKLHPDNLPHPPPPPHPFPPLHHPRIPPRTKLAHLRALVHEVLRVHTTAWSAREVCEPTTLALKPGDGASAAPRIYSPAKALSSLCLARCCTATPSSMRSRRCSMRNAS
jgi:hypothetical protein